VHLYSGMTVDFVADATRNRIAQQLSEAFFAYFRYQPAHSEVRSWQSSLRAMADAVELANLDDHGVVVELQLPLSSRRLDCMLTGHDDRARAQAIIVELKQWEKAGPSEIDDCVVTFLGGRERDVLHPSRQVGNYQRYLQDVHTAFNEGAIGLNSCSYLHNMRFDPSAEVLKPKHKQLLAQWPLFTGDQVDQLATFLTDQVSSGDGGPILDEVLKGRYRPHKRLLEHTAAMIRREPTYTLLDEQQVAFNHILGRVRDRQRSTEQTVFLVKGGPGTGKSVIAVNLLAELSGDGFATMHATGSKAFTETLRKSVGPRAGVQFGYFNGFASAEEKVLDAIICDESHRIRSTSNSRFMKKEERSDASQVDELMRASKVAIFFIDDMQVVRPGEVGSSSLIREAAARAGARLYEHELEAQFRCAGSEEFVSWVENTLEIRAAQPVLLDPEGEFDFDIVDSPQELEGLIRAKALEDSSARLTAGFCWKWSDPHPDGTLESDVQIGSWSMPWNARPDAGRLAKGVPKASHWVRDPGGIDQVGCVYTAQGFEYDYAGVIFGRDLVWRARKGWIGQPEFSQDSVVRRGAQKEPGRFTDLVKNTYRVLLTRGLRGCYVYFEDEQTRDFVLSRVDWQE
jgi:DUF2075 family protein